MPAARQPSVDDPGLTPGFPDPQHASVAGDTTPVRTILHVAFAAVTRHFGKFAKWHGAAERPLEIDAELVRLVERGGKAVGRLASFHPCLDGAQRVETAGAFSDPAATAMRGARKHEHADVLVELVISAERLRKIFVVVDGHVWGKKVIAQVHPQDHLVIALDEFCGVLRNIADTHA